MDPVKVLICSARQDDDLLEQMETHFALLEHQKMIELLDDRALPLGKDGDAERIELVRQADLALLLVSPALMGSMKRNLMLQRALDRFVNRELLLIPVIARPTDWQEYSFGKLVALPRDGRAVTQWRNHDEAWVAITKELREVLAQKRHKLVGPSLSPPTSAAPSPTSKSAGGFTRGHALIIGTGGSGIEVTERDAEAVHTLLGDPRRAGYPAGQLKLLKGSTATRDNILTELDDLATRVKQDPDRDSTAMIYFSGHGLRKPAPSPAYYLIPHGYKDGHEATTAISGAEFSARIAAIPARKLIVFLDCCHAAGVPKAPGFAPAPIPPDLEDQLGRGSGLVIVASSREDERSYTGTPYSVFTTCLLEALDGKGSTDEYARVLNVVGHLLQAVPARQPNQHPMIKKMLDLGENFPLCYHGQSATLPTPKAPVASDGLPSSRRKRLERDLAGLNGALSLLEQKRDLIRKRLSFETSVSVQFQLQQELIEVEKSIADLDAKIDAIETQLQND